jgi:hypothetical protein
LAEGIEIEEEMTQVQWEVPNDDGGEEDGDSWVDEVAALSIADREELEANVRPIRLVLVKVSHLFKLVMSNWTYQNIIVAS